MSISSIDDLLMGVGNSQQPATPEHKEKQEKAPIEEMEPETPEYESEELSPAPDESENDLDDKEDNGYPEDEEKLDSRSDTDSAQESEEDEYGNKKELMSKRMKERLEKKEKQHQRELEQRDYELQQLRQQLSNQGASSQVQKAAADFEYNPNDESSWQQQLTDFVKQTVKGMHTDEQEKIREVQEHNEEREFKEKFTKGMNRFHDFLEVVGQQPIDDAMTLSLRGVADPSAFIYAASKRHPLEIERISKLPSRYARIVEMGKLEERMRRNKPSTKAPRPLGRTREDATTKVKPKERDTSGDDLLAKADAKRLATVKNRHKSNR